MKRVTDNRMSKQVSKLNTKDELQRLREEQAEAQRRLNRLQQIRAEKAKKYSDTYEKSVPK